jgi:CheY-like chemotaxis protein
MTDEGLNIVILEDNAERQALMQERLQDRLPQYRPHFFATAAECIGFLQRRLPDTVAIALDHDLDMIPIGSQRMLDAGTGRDVADYLATQTPICPVVVHTTNLPAADGMSAVLQESGWQVERVAPYGDLEWISELWFPSLREAMSVWTRTVARKLASAR